MRGARVRNGVTDWHGKQILKANTMKALLGGGGGAVHFLHPPPRFTPRSTPDVG